MSLDWAYIGNKVIQTAKGFVYGLIPLRGDTSSEVEFYLIDAFEIAHFRPLYEKLKKAGIRARIVAEPPWVNTAGDWFDYKTAVRLLKQEHIDYLTKANPDARAAVTTQYGRNLAKYNNRKIQMYYGVSLVPSADFMTDPEVTREFDYVLVHGDYSKEIIGRTLPQDHVIVMSYPRYAAWKELVPDREQIRTALGIRTDRPVLLYCPTWDAYSSIRTFADAIRELRQTFFVVTKPHHCTARNLWNNTDMNVLREISDMMLDANYSLLHTCYIGDVTVTDIKSGASTEMPFVNPALRQVICQVNVNDEDRYAGIDRFALVAKQPEELVLHAKRALEEDPCLEGRKEITDSFYLPDMNAGTENVIRLIGHLCGRDAEACDRQASD